ncbi:MAG: diguanylate cyclase, partial [Deltaproteobacteria bacterium]
AQRLREERATVLTPVIFLSARGRTADKVRAFKLGAEDYLVKPFDAQELLARVEKSLARREAELSASPTTKLPGSHAIEAEIDRRLELAHAGGSDFAFCYLDLDNLKAFNDYYGYAKANAVIRQTGDVIRHIVTRSGGPGDFIGHIAGDDFVFITSLERVDEVCRGICERFDHLIRLYYDPADRGHGYIETKDRFGVQRRFPIMSVSIAAISVGRAKSYAALAELAAVGKRAAKDRIRTLPGTCIASWSSRWPSWPSPRRACGPRRGIAASTARCARRAAARPARATTSDRSPTTPCARRAAARSSSAPRAMVRCGARRRPP